MALSIVNTVGARDANSYVSLAAAEAYFEADPERSAGWAALAAEEKMRFLIGAARTIDRQRWTGERLVDYELRPFGLRQGLAFPRGGHHRRIGRAAAGGTGELTDGGLAGREDRPDDFFAGGAVIITGGPNRGLARTVTAFDSDTGRLTVEAFPVSIEPGDGYILLWPLDQAVVRAALEQAGYCLAGGPDGLEDLAGQGLTSASVDGLSLRFDRRAAPGLCLKAKELLARYRDANAALRRG